MCADSYLSIGDVVRRLASQYPDLSVSKIRFLEDKGLISPERTKGGYRKFSTADVKRLEAILKLQKLHFYPLSVIRSKLNAVDRGESLPELDILDEEAAENATQLFEGQPQPLASISEMLDVPTAFIRELGQYGLLNIEKGESGPVIDGGAMTLIQACWRLRGYGIDPRHLKGYVNAANREAALLSQAVLPQLKAATAESRKQGMERLGELESLTASVKRSLFRAALEKELEGIGDLKDL